MTSSAADSPDAPPAGFREGNLRALGRRFSELESLLRNSDAAVLEVLQTPKGFPTARAAGRLLHSRYDPEGEARKAAATAEAAGADTLVILGPGLFYAAEAALNGFPGLRVIAVSADPSFLAACLELRDLQTPLADERLSILAGGPPEGLLWIFERLGTRRIRVLENKAELELYPEWYGRAKAVLTRWESKETINSATLKRFGRLWVRNLARNLDEIPRHPGVAELEGTFSRIPAVVAAAGPSLDKILPILAGHRDRAVLVCVDTALRSVLGSGVEPDFVVVVDPQYWNARHLDRCPTCRSILVTEAAVWPSVLRMPFASVRFCASLYPLGAFAEGRAGASKGRLGAGGSVATTAWDFARVLGCRPVYMAGLDLGFPGGRTHARAGRFEQKALAEGRRLRPPSTYLYEAYAGAHPREAPANDGGTVRTDERLALYSWWFESRMLRHPDCPTRNLSSGGLAIPGMPFEPAETLLYVPPIRVRIDAVLEPFRREDRESANGIGAPADTRSRILGLLSDMEARSDAALDLTARARKIAREGRDPSEVLSLLDQADRDLLGNEAKEVAGFLLSDLESLVGGPARTLEEALDRSEAVYREIRDSAAYHRRILA